jgi:hypothetical protein
LKSFRRGRNIIFTNRLHAAGTGLTRWLVGGIVFTGRYCNGRRQYGKVEASGRIVSVFAVMAAWAAICIPGICRAVTAFWTFAAVRALSTLTAFWAAWARIALFAVVRFLIGCVFRVVIPRRRLVIIIGRSIIIRRAVVILPIVAIIAIVVARFVTGAALA